MRRILFLLVIVSFFSCDNKKKDVAKTLDIASKESLGVHKDGEFQNYISLEGKVFKDGGIDFYPMVINYSIDIFTTNNLEDIDIYAVPLSKYHPFYGNKFDEYHHYPKHSLFCLHVILFQIYFFHELNLDF